ncbi:2-oxoacid dehydrogenases acyltransferase-domain-containing protein [Radiomyces spectabilis]|uniref:2-oxoacid dehydrogenases acyltransferase-domain-containing protein n=1 Tax=Radiomyces spectabilis TaxID=64574 RepID=UPI0022204B3B|nr:2-oxoacid dehydrogenases acyltransferase-domain-containing protein [Radiomyces spectabilis]KAI8391134.1 2-oxoacid dehydrogenases acyltransferase-domain-containing protein [Radiomyces spectabilis]
MFAARQQFVRKSATLGSSVRVAASRAMARALPVAGQQAARGFSTSMAPKFIALRALAQPTVAKDAKYYSAKAYPAHNVIAMPALSPTMTAGGIGAFQKKVGDELQPGDVLMEIETDKAQMDFECQEEGFIAKILVQEGDKDVPVGKPIAILVEDEADIAAFEDYKVEDAAPAKKEEPTKAEAAPATLEPAKKEEKPAAAKQETPVQKPAAPAASAPSAPKAAAPAYTPQSATGDAFADIPTSNMRKIIGSRLQECKQTVPHYYLTVEINMDKVNKLREVLNKSGNGQYKLSVNDFIIKASALSLKKVPEVNASWHNDFIRQYHTSDICVAVATPTGLITPIVTKAESKGLATISSQVKEMAGRARNGKLAPHEYQGGSFTISNLGMYGIKHFTAIINPPGACILAIGGTQKKVIADATQERGVAVRDVMEVTLSADHRVVDGAVGATWLQAFKEFMENPLKMML